MIICMVAILKAGAAFMCLDPHYSLNRLTIMLESSQARVILTSEACVHALPTNGYTIMCIFISFGFIVGLMLVDHVIVKVMMRRREEGRRRREEGSCYSYLLTIMILLIFY